MATIDYNTAAATGLSTVKPHVVYIRAAWADAWTARPDLHCIQCVWNAAPNTNTATLLRDYGRTILPNETAFTTRTPVALEGYFVRIDWANDESGINYWLGFIDSHANSPDGPTDGTVPASGRQSLSCYGMDRILQLAPILDAAWRDGVGILRGGHGFDFNKDGYPNRTTTKISGTHVFEPDYAESKYWSSRDIIEYLLKYHLPTATGLVGTIPWAIANLTLVPIWDQPRITVSGRTVYDIINELLDSRRLLGWATGFNNTSLTVAPFSIAQSTVTLSNTDFPANATQHTFTYAADPLTDGVIAVDRTDQVDQVVVRGSLRVSICTLDGVDDMKAGWTTSAEEDYEEGASLDAGYAALDQIDQREANARARRTPLFYSVYSVMNLKDAWGYTVANGADTENVFPPVTGTDPYKPFKIKFLPRLPMQHGVDYTDVSTSPPVGDFDFRETYVTFIYPTAIEDDAVRLDASEVGVSFTSLPEKGGEIDFSIDIAAESNGLRLTVLGGERHAISGLDFTELPVDDVATSKLAIKRIRATVAMQDDRYCEGVWPASAPAVDVVRRRVIYAGAGYQKIYMVPGTVIGMNADKSEKKSTAGGYLRDDTVALINLARLLASYHTNPRISMVINSHRVTGLANIGDMVATANGDSIGSVITRIQIDSPLGDGGSFRDVTQTIVATSMPLDYLATLQLAAERS